MANADPEADLEEFCRKAIEAYKHETGSSDVIDDILKTKLTTFHEFEQLLEKREAAFKSFRSKHDKVYRRIQEFLGPIIPLARTGFQMVNGSTFGLPVSVVLGVVIHLVQVSVFHRHSREALRYPVLMTATKAYPMQAVTNGAQQTCKGVSDAFDWIEQVFVELNDYAQCLKSYMQLPIPKPMERKIAQIMIL